ncbi:hemagglutinin repeat-containing protein, partial [Microbulbifer epialgicus]
MKSENKMEKSSHTKWQRIIASLVTFFFSMQLCMPAMAGVIGMLDSALIEAELNTNYLFQQEESSEYQFKSADFLNTNAHQSDASIETFFERLKESSKENLSDPLMIPIRVGDITIIMPHYPLGKRVGTNFVQSRYIRSQVYAQLGRNLINTQVYGTEQEQISKLYDNAYNHALITGKIFGEPFGLTTEQITADMIWPEIRYINSENVLVPILYLKSSTIESRQVTGDENEFGGNLIELGGLQINNSDITFRRNAFLKVAENLVNNQGNLIAEDDLKIVAGGVVQNISGLIESDGDLIIGAHSIENRTIVHRYNLGSLQSERFGPIAEINANGDIFFKTSSDITLLGSVVSAGETIRFEAGGDIYIGSQQITNHREGSSGSISYQRSTISHLASKVSAADAISMIAQGNILIDASEIVSDNGHIELLAGLGITVEDNLNVTQSYKKGKFGKRKIEESVYQTVAIRSLLDAGKGIRLHSEFGDITLRAADIKSGSGTEVKALGGKVNLLMTTETDHYSYTSVKKGLFTVSTESRGHAIETGIPNSIVGGFSVEAVGGISVEYEGNPELSLDEQIAELSKLEGMEWMAEVRTNFPDADWTAIELQYDKWNESSTSISPAFAAVITVAMAVASGGSSLAGTTWWNAALAAG